LGKRLDKELKDLNTLRAEMRFTLAKPFEDANHIDLPVFNFTWLRQSALKVAEETSRAGLALAPNFLPQHFRYMPKEDRVQEVNLNDRPNRIFRVALAWQVADILAGTTTVVQRRSPLKDETEDVTVRAVSLDDLKLEPDVADRRSNAALSRAYEMVHNSGRPVPAPPVKDLKVWTMEIKFTALFPLVPKVVEALESGPAADAKDAKVRYFGVVRSVDIVRAADPYPEVRPGGEANTGNTYMLEAPVQVLVIVDLLEAV
jgi:hypothetical protein